METLSASNWSLIWSYLSYFLVAISCFKLAFQKKYKYSNIPYFSENFLKVLIVIIIVFFAYEPIQIYSDKWNYIFEFKNNNNYTDGFGPLGAGFYFLNKFILLFTHSSFAYFFIIASLYIITYYYFIKSVFLKPYRYLVFIFLISSLGFYSYGTNTIRQGLALVVFMLVLLEKKLNFKFFILAFLAILIHKSLAFPVVAYIIIQFKNVKDNYFKFWLFSLFITLFFGNMIVNYLGSFMVDSEQRIQGYLNNSVLYYNSGFRIDFLFYSVLPILYGLVIKKRGFNDVFFNRLFSLYILVNAIWLLFIRLPFTDRFAYLSWVLIPYIVVYPLMRNNIFKHQNLWLARIIFLFATINFYLTVF